MIPEHLHPHVWSSRDERGWRGYAHHDMPYPVDCAILGHKPAWVPNNGMGFYECSRCTLRPHMTQVAQQWTGVGGDLSASPRQFMERALSEGEVYWHPRRGETHLQVGSRYVDRFQVQVSLGSAISETPLDAHLIIPGWRGFYFGTNVIGRRIACRRSRRTGAWPTTKWSFTIDRQGARFRRETTR